MHLRHIAHGFMCLDLKAAQTVTESYTREEKLRNIVPHFEFLWKSPPPKELILDWLESDELYHFHDVMNLPNFQNYVGSLPHQQLLALVNTPKASHFYIRMVESRIWRLQEQKTINGLAAQDLRGCFEINLGLSITEQATDENAYLARLTQNQFMAKVRLARVLDDARLLRSRINTAFEQGALSDDVLPSLRLRFRAIKEHFEEASKLLEEKHSEPLLDHTSEGWL